MEINLSIRAKTFLWNSNQSLIELRLYVRQFTVAHLPELQLRVMEELAHRGIHPAPDQLGVCSNRAGLHFFCIIQAKPSPAFLAKLKERGWRPAKN